MADPTEWRYGKSSRPEYGIYRGMTARCENKSNRSFPNYGGRGIKVCKRWLDSFEAFLADVGPRPSPKYSLDRIDNNGNYEPSNCRWATAKVQSRNTRTNVIVTVCGEKMTASEAVERYGISYDTVMRRHTRHLPIHPYRTVPYKKPHV